MLILQILGRVLPEHYKTTIKNHPSIHWRHEQFGLDAYFDITLDSGKVHVFVELNQFDEAKHTSQILC